MKERYHVTGMSCSACSSHVEKAVNKLENVEKASVNLLTETMDVTYDETKITAGLHMFLQDRIAKSLQGALHRSYLRQDISAVAVFFQHPADTVQLSRHAA